MCFWLLDNGAFHSRMNAFKKILTLTQYLLNFQALLAWQSA
jgi:hypothetical protein